jgi:cation transport ATPase
MFISPEVMKMDENKAFYESPAYEALKDDVIGWELSYLNEPFVEYNNTNLTAQQADEELVQRYKKVIDYAGDPFKQSVNEFMEGKLAEERYKELTEIAGLVSNYDPEVKSPNIQMYNTTSGAVILMYVTLICSMIMVLKPKVFESILYMTVVLFFTIFFLFQNAYYFIVEKGFPLIHYEQVSPNYLLLIVVMILSVLSIYLFFKTERKDS